jgi:uncharacterized protein (TIGR01777 family)
MRLLITGGTGFIGTAVSKHFLKRGHEVIATGTSARHTRIEHENFVYLQTDTTREGTWQEELSRVDGVINLAGRNILRRWTPTYRKMIYDSRILTTRHVVDALPEKNDLFLFSASAVGVYGNRGDEVLPETAEPGSGFLAEVGRDWEAEAQRAAGKGVRVVCMRFGVVLGKGGGAMEKMVPAFRMYVGGPLGDGNQWFPWIELDDVIGALQFLMERPELCDVFNFTAPNPVRNSELARVLGKVLRVPAFLPTPRIMARLALGDVADVLFDSQRVVPAKLLESGYRFIHPDIEGAVQKIVQ